MPLLGSAAMLLAFDIVADAITEHDHWHTYEHLPERLGITGFLRGTRWVAMRGQPRYLVVAGYRESALADLEAQGLATASLAAHGAEAPVEGQYVMDCSLTDAEVLRANAAGTIRGAPGR